MIVLNIINLRKIMLSYLNIMLAFRQKMAENTENQHIQKINTYGSALLQGVRSIYIVPYFYNDLAPPYDSALWRSRGIVILY